MAKEIEWENPNKMKFESRHIIFNAQADYISPGNVLSHVQNSSYIRPFNQLGDESIEIKPSDQLRYKPGEAGYFQESDLDIYLLKNAPEPVKNWIRELPYAKDNGVILYHFFYEDQTKKVPVGDVVTTTDHRLLKKWVNKGDNFESVIDEAIKYITD